MQAVAGGGANVAVEAGAGCAKTTTLELAAQQVRIGSLALAFNKKIAGELQQRLPANFDCRTLNSLGHRAWGNQIKPNIQLDPKKLGKLVTEVARAAKVQLAQEQWDSLRRLVTDAQTQGLVPADFDPNGTTLVNDDYEGWRDLGDLQLLDKDDFELLYPLAREVLEADIRAGLGGVLSFDDQIYLPTMLGGRWPRYPWVFLDENQDLNPVNIKMVGLCMAPQGRLLSVGDRHQACYAFRGAAGDASQRIKLLSGGPWQDLPLMTTFRCPKSIVERQHHHLPSFRAHHDNPYGDVVSLMGDSYKDEGWTWRDLQQVAVGDHIAILCRNNAPLLAMAFRLLRKQIPCRMLGREIGTGLTALAKKIAPQPVSVDVFLGRLGEWLVTEVSKARANGKDDLVDGLEDRAACLRAILVGAQCTDSSQFQLALKSLFDNTTAGKITLSTIHRAKGLEWPTVLHLDPWRCRSNGQGYLIGNHDTNQDNNLRYIAETRTQHTLVLANGEDFH